MSIVKHKNAEWISLWADGYPLEACGKLDIWLPVLPNHNWDLDLQYRVTLIKELPRHTIECFKEWVTGFFNSLSNAKTFDYDYWTGWRGYYDINVYNSDEDDDNPRMGQWSVHLMQGYPGNAGYQTLVSLEVRWNLTSREFRITSESVFVTVTAEKS